jgi:hypothetical protein
MPVARDGIAARTPMSSPIAPDRSAQSEAQRPAIRLRAWRRHRAPASTASFIRTIVARASHDALRYGRPANLRGCGSDPAVSLRRGLCLSARSYLIDTRRKLPAGTFRPWRRRGSAFGMVVLLFADAQRQSVWSSCSSSRFARARLVVATKRPLAVRRDLAPRLAAHHQSAPIPRPARPTPRVR